MAESNIAFPLNHTGDFKIGTGAPGAPLLRPVLTVPQNSSRVSGQGWFTQPVNPPLRFDNAFTGIVSVLTLPPAPARQVYSLQGSAIPPLLGAPHVTHLMITLEGIWGTKGTASYQYVIGSTFHDVNNVPVSVVWLLQEA